MVNGVAVDVIPDDELQQTGYNLRKKIRGNTSCLLKHAPLITGLIFVLMSMCSSYTSTIKIIGTVDHLLVKLTES